MAVQQSLKITIVTPTYYPHINGASYFAQRFACYLQKRGHAVLVIAPSRSMKHEFFTSEGVSVLGIRSFPVFINEFRIGQPLGVKKKLQKAIEIFSPDIIHLQTHLLYAKEMISIARKRKIPIVGTNHFMPENLVHFLHLPEKAEGYLKKLAWMHFCGIYLKLDAVTAPTQIGANLLKKIGFKGKVQPISCGIDLDIFHPKNNGDYLKKKYRIPNRPSILYVGRLDKEKNVDRMLRAFALIAKKKNAHFVIVGDGAERNNLEKLALKLDIVNNVTFTGFVTDQDLPNVYRIADCFVIAGIAELQSIVTMEAMASGLPVVAVNAMALPHLVRNRENGFLFKLDNIEDISKKISKILFDSKLRLKMSKRSLEIIKEHDIEQAISAYESLYLKSISDKRKI